MNSKQKTNLLSQELRQLFMPVIRDRGRKYARTGRVRITSMDKTEIRAVVKGTSAYKVAIRLKDFERGQVKISCTCPFFRQGIPCKHIWATICATDMMTSLLHDLPEPDEKKPMPAERIFQEDLWEIDRRAPWKPLQDFMLMYRLSLKDGNPSVNVVEQYIRKDGGLGRTRKPSTAIMENPHLPSQDKLLLPFLKDVAEKDNFFAGLARFSGNFSLGSVNLSPEEAGVALPLLAETGRCTMVIEDDHTEPRIIRSAHETAAAIEIQAERSGKKLVRLEPRIILPGQEPCHLPVRDVILVNSKPLYFIHEGMLYRLDGPTFKWLRQVQENGLAEIRHNDLPKLVKKASSMQKGDMLKLHEELSPEKIKGIKPQLCLTLEIKDHDIIAWPSMRYMDHGVSPHHKEPVIYDYDEWKAIQRDMHEEQRLLDMLHNSGFEYDSLEECLHLPMEKAAKVLEDMEHQGVILEARDKKRFITGSIKTFTIISGIDWFDMKADVSFGGETVPLPRIVKAYLRGKRTIRLGAGKEGLLPLEWLERHREKLEFSQSATQSGDKETMRFPVSQALLIDQMLSEAKEVRADKQFKAISDKIRAFSGIKPSDEPPGFQGRLRGYQKEALGWFQFLRELGLGGILADDMGLGKTVQVLACLQQQKVNGGKTPSLIVVPTSLVFNWQAEAAKFTPELRIATYLGPGRHGTLDECIKADIVLTTYGIMRRDISQIRMVEFDYAVLDESQAIKNPESVTSRAVRLINAKHKLCLTGTPLENHIGELWSQMEFLNPGMLGSKDRYMRRYAKPLTQGDRDVLSILRQMVKPFILRRAKEEVASELPEKQETIVRCTMTPEQETLYARLRDHYRATIMKTVADKGIKRSKIKVLEGLLRLRQAANHPALIGMDDIDSGKFLQLIELIEETVAGGHKALVFSQFTRMLGLIKRRLQEKGLTFEYLDGRTPQARRSERVANFQQNPDIQLFLISLRAGGLGLNLTAADYVFIVDPWWNPAVELQAVDRTHRIGQTRKVVIYRLISRDSVEEKVLKLQKKKQEIVSSILSGSRNMLANLSAKDLEVLFS